MTTSRMGIIGRRLVSDFSLDVSMVMLLVKRTSSYCMTLVRDGSDFTVLVRKMAGIARTIRGAGLGAAGVAPHV